MNEIDNLKLAACSKSGMARCNDVITSFIGFSIFYKVNVLSVRLISVCFWLSEADFVLGQNFFGSCLFGFKTLHIMLA